MRSRKETPDVPLNLAAAEGVGRASFVGRRAERKQLAAELQRGVRLLSIIGPSGMGKTRLAQMLTRDVATSYPGRGRLRFCSLVGAGDRLDVEDAISRALGLTRDHAPRLTHAMGGIRTRLLVLDNVDARVADVRPIVTKLLAELTSLQIVVTSIVPLELPGEVHFELGRLQTEDAAALYLDRVKRLFGGRPLPQREADAIVELVGRLDGIPLAIELAAGRAELLPPHALLSQLGRRFEILDSKQPGRHGSLAQALSVTWDLLTPAERLLLYRTSVFVGGFSLEAAGGVLSMGTQETLSLLDGLRSKALLQFEDGETLRFSQYESVREFALLQDQGQESARENIDRHLAFFLERGEFHAARVTGPEGAGSIRWLLTEHENLLAAFRRAQEHAPSDAARVGLTLAVVLETMGPHPSQIEILNAVVAAARASTSSPLLLRALITRAEAFGKRGLTADALGDLAEAKRLARALGDATQQVEILAESARNHAARGAFDRAQAEIDEALHLIQKHPHPIDEGKILVACSLLDERRGEHEAANRLLLRAFNLFRRGGAQSHLATTLFNLGVNWSQLLDFQRARGYFRQAQLLYQQVGHRTLAAYSELNLGAMELAAGRLERAEAHTVQALRMKGIQGRGRFEAQGLINLGVVALERGQIATAEERLLEALQITRENDEASGIARTLLYASAATAMLGRVAEAREMLEEARAYFERVDDRFHRHAAAVYECVIEGCEAQLRETGDTSHLQGRAADLLRSASDPLLFRTTSLAIGLRLLEQSLSSPVRRPDREVGPLTIGPDGAWLQWGDGSRTSLGRRYRLRRMLLTLAKRRRASPGEGLTVEELFTAVWPNETIRLESMTQRVYTTVWELRKLGLSSAIIHQGEGYLLDPQVSVQLLTTKKREHHRSAGRR